MCDNGQGSIYEPFVCSAGERGWQGHPQLFPSFCREGHRSAVVVCPGGAYWIVAMQHEGTDWAEYFNQQGIACFVLKYRLPHGNRQLPIGDAMAAMKMVRDSADVWHVNPYDVGIMGSSAGGHLASTISTHADFAHRPNFSILFYPVISMDEKKGHAGSAKNLLGKEWHNPELVKEFSNQLHVQRHLTPPAILLLANDDVSVPPVTNAVAYYSAMRSKGGKCALYIYPSGGHGLDLIPSSSITMRCLAILPHGSTSCPVIAAMPSV